MASFQRMPGDSTDSIFWMPDQVRHDEPMTFHEFIKIDVFNGSSMANGMNNSMSGGAYCQDNSIDERGVRALVRIAYLVFGLLRVEFSGDVVLLCY